MIRIEQLRKGKRTITVDGLVISEDELITPGGVKEYLKNIMPKLIKGKTSNYEDFDQNGVVFSYNDKKNNIQATVKATSLRYSRCWTAYEEEHQPEENFIPVMQSFCKEAFIIRKYQDAECIPIKGVEKDYVKLFAVCQEVRNEETGEVEKTVIDYVLLIFMKPYKQISTESAWSESEVLELAEQLLTGLTAVHEEYVHGSIESKNIVQYSDGTYALVHWDAAKENDEPLKNDETLKADRVALGNVMKKLCKVRSANFERITDRVDQYKTTKAMKDAIAKECGRRVPMHYALAAVAAVVLVLSFCLSAISGFANETDAMNTRNVIFSYCIICAVVAFVGYGKKLLIKWNTIGIIVGTWLISAIVALFVAQQRVLYLPTHIFLIQAGASAAMVYVGKEWLPRLFNKKSNQTKASTMCTWGFGGAAFGLNLGLVFSVVPQFENNEYLVSLRLSERFIVILVFMLIGCLVSATLAAAVNMLKIRWSSN